MDQLAKSGRLKNLRAIKEEKGKRTAENMIMAGMDKLIIWLTETRCKVPSQSIPNLLYDVDVVNVNCSCPASTQGGKNTFDTFFSKLIKKNLFILFPFCTNFAVVLWYGAVVRVVIVCVPSFLLNNFCSNHKILTQGFLA